MPFQPLASQMYSGDAAHATSRTFFAANFQVSMPLVVRARRARLVSSSSVTMCTGVADFAACASRATCVGVSTSRAFVSAPVLATM